MAVCADYVSQGVRRAQNISARKSFGVTVQTCIQNLSRRHERKRARDRGLSSAGLDMGRGRAVAALAARALGRQVTRRYALIMRILVEVKPDVGVAGLTFLAADVTAGGSLGARYQCCQK